VKARNPQHGGGGAPAVRGDLAASRSARLSIMVFEMRRRGPLLLRVPRRPGVDEESRARTQGECSREYERGSLH